MSRTYTDSGYVILWNEQDGAEIERLYVDERFSMLEIAAKLGSTENRVRRILEERKAQIRSPGASVMWKVDYGALKKEYERCMDVCRLAAQHGVRTATMTRWLRDAGVVFSEPRESPGVTWPGYPLIGVAETDDES